MKLGELLAGVAVEQVRGSLDVEIAEVRDDSRDVGAGDLFVAVPGLRVDGHRFLGDVAAKGVSAVVVEREVDAAVLPVAWPGTWVRVASTARALARIAANRFGNPARSLELIGITGTNGKTTTTYLVESILRAAGRKPGIIGTIRYRYDGRELPAPFTTPTALELHQVLAAMRDAGCTHVVMEASSHALALDRLDSVEFHVGAFTNLTQDHLDFHQTMEAYFAAKAALMRRALRVGDGVGVVLVDGPYGPRMAKQVVGERLLVSLRRNDADVYLQRVEHTLDGMRAELASPLGAIRLSTRLLGEHNLENVAVAVAVAVALGIGIGAIEEGVRRLDGVPGRLERVELPEGERAPTGLPVVLVDYAHTPDALEHVLAALRPLTKGRLLCVFGCGGDRDRTKRPVMGGVVMRDADLAVVTSDNPRTEEPGAIIADVLAGMDGAPSLTRAELATARSGKWVEADRRAAIEAVIDAMQQNDVLLVAGKGHEDYQIIGRTKHPFDDREVARAALARRVAGRQS